MSEVHGDTNNKEVKKLAEDKSKVIDVVFVMDIVLEELEKEMMISIPHFATNPLINKII